MNKQLIASAVALALFGAAPAMADETTSSIRGQVNTPSGAPAANTHIIITHIPTGITRQVDTNDSGAFSVRGLRVGGPYRIVIDSDIYQDDTINDVYLELGNPYVVRENLVSNDDNKIVITGSALGVHLPNSGSNSVFGSKQIEASPSLNRDLKSVLRRNPLVNVLDDDTNSMSVAGNNPRYNSLSIDGVRQDDDFGLNGSGYPTQRSPISIDAIDQISVATNPFSVKDGGFSGAGIKVVTKSGTNKFKGKVFYEKTNDALSGTPKDQNGDSIPLDFEEVTKGFSLGGPIIKDKLFFYMNYEKFNSPKSFESGPSDFSSANPADVTSADANEVIRIARDVYGVDSGSWQQDAVEQDIKKLLKLDWYLNYQHHASFTYQDTDGELTANRIGGRRLNLSSDWYTRGDHLTAYSFQWFADWTSAFSTEVRIADKTVDNTQTPVNGLGMGEVNVRTGTGDVRFGPDRSRHANKLSNDNLQLMINAEYLMGNHTLNAGWAHDKIDVFNIFVPESLGVWNFNSLADFENRTADSFSYQNADSNNANDGAANFSLTTDTLYLGDVWDISYNFSLQYGLRYESIHTNDEPRFNQNFMDRYGFSNTATLDGEDILLPRLGFTWNLNDEFTLSGGLGKYSGGRPNVWLSNAYTNDGVTIVRPNLSSLDPSTYLNNVDITQVPTAVQETLSAGDGNSTPIDPNFNIPAHWQYSLKANYIADLGALGSAWDLNAEIIYKNIVRDVKWVDLAREQVGTTVDGRPIYGSFDPVTNNRDHYDLLLTNSKGGDSTIMTFSADKSFSNGVDLNVSYTHQNVNDRVPGTSSTAESNYAFTTVRDRQNPDVATAAYEVEHRFAMNLDYSVNLFEGYTTTVGLFMERVSGRPYSWTLGAFRDRDFGDQSRFYNSDVYLPYIPTGADDAAVDFSCSRCLSYEQILEQLQANGISTEGGSLKRNKYSSPWKTNMDLYLSQQLPGFSKEHKGELYFNIDNVLNLLQKHRGQIYSNRFGESQQILFDYDLNADGQYQYQEPFGGYRNGSPAEFRAKESTWRLKVGVRYNF